jgi:diguanylate cyclase (GGDEF)-like protein
MADDLVAEGRSSQQAPTPDYETERRALLDALGVNLLELSRHERAAMEALCEEVIALRADAAALHSQLDEAESLADNDALCPVFNRRAFEREVRREIALAGRFKTPLSLIFMDLDGFKQVNDVFGHAIGDDVLLRISNILVDRTRETDIVGRLGGDEFAVVLAHSSVTGSLEKARQLSEAIDALTVRDGEQVDGPGVSIGASCGVVEWQPGQTAAQLIAHADQAMFAEKARRKAARRGL